MPREPQSIALFQASRAIAAIIQGPKIQRQGSNRNSKTLREKKRCTRSAATTKTLPPRPAAPGEQKPILRQEPRGRTNGDTRAPPSLWETAAQARRATRPSPDRDTRPNR